MQALQALQNALSGFALCKVKFDDHGKPCDLTLLEVTPAFEKLIKLKAADLVGHSVKGVMTRLFLNSYDWLGFFCGAAVAQKSNSHRLFVLAVGRYLSIDVFGAGESQCIVQLTDVTEDVFNTYKLNSMLTAVDEYIIEFDSKFRCLSIFSSDNTFLEQNKEHYIGKTAKQAFEPKLSSMFENVFREAEAGRQRLPTGAEGHGYPAALPHTAYCRCL